MKTPEQYSIHYADLRRKYALKDFMRKVRSNKWPLLILGGCIAALVFFILPFVAWAWTLFLEGLKLL